MTGTVFLILCVLSFMLVPCEGQIMPPTNGTKLTFLPGTTRKIDWSVVPTSQIQLRSWRFKSTDGSRAGELTAIVGTTHDPKNLSLIPRFEIEEPATLILQNVDETYNGMYTFRLIRRNVAEETSEVTVIIAAKPTLTVTQSAVTVDEGENVTLSGTSTGGRPPANVTWRKNGTEIGKTKVQNNTVVLRNVSAKDTGTYVCTAESYPDDKYRDSKTVQVNVRLNYSPTNVRIVSKWSDQSVTLTCTADGRPEPSYKIFFNETKLVKSDKTHTIPNVKSVDVGYYKCVAENKLGKLSSEPKYLPLTGPPQPSQPSDKSNGKNGPDFKDEESGGSGGLGGGAIAGIVIGALVLVVIIIVVVYYIKTRERNGYKGNANVRPGGNERNEADENNYDSVAPSRASGSKAKPSKGDAPVLYSTVDKENRQGRPLYATLDQAALQSQGSSRTPDEARPEPTQYARIEFGKNGEEVPRADLV